MKRLERLTALLVFLQSKRYTTVEQIRDKFSISIRTVYRDIRALIEAGTPIAYETDLGYFIASGYFLKPLHFSAAESKSLLFADQLMQKYTDRVTYSHFITAFEKIKNNLTDTQLEDIEELETKLRTYIGPNNEFYTRYVLQAEHACSHKEVLFIRYQNNKQEISEREIEPIGMTFYGQNWHIIAYCNLRNDYRDFAISRIQELSVIGQHQKKHISLAEYIRQLEKK
ncbi:MAG: WYL domain-containing protein [Calditrichaeota bacterium]|nr:WYL domain-containing protein [Calditrichota bacterium]